MSWLSEGWKKLSGQNQKVDPSKIGGEWDRAYGTDDSGLMGDYGWLQQQGKDMMDPYSQKNMGAYARMGQQSSEGQSQMFRNMQRLAAQQGGGASGNTIPNYKGLRVKTHLPTTPRRVPGMPQ